MFNILIVEDDKNLRKLIGTVLKQNGFNVLCANDGEQALEVLDSTKADLIICDIMMPNMDGYELTESLRWSNYNMPILMITAKETLEDKRKGFLSGADDYMVKPINTDEMLLSNPFWNCTKYTFIPDPAALIAAPVHAVVLPLPSPV
jgi:two-component system OmpR family response regulator